ncbi:MAG: hypothetical protein HUJ42_02600 [Malacoplasma sp.]|nr:hypothetical protein [Malacoplasma sp.]
MKNKSLFSKLLFSTFLTMGSVCCVASLTSPQKGMDNKYNTNVIQQSKTNSLLNAATNTLDATSIGLTNRMQMPATLPNNFNDYSLFAKDNNNQLVQTSMGILGISKDYKTFYFTSYSGKLIWANQFNTNPLMVSFYNLKQLKQNTNGDINNLTIKSWTKLSDSLLAVILSDNVNTIVVALNLNTGLFAGEVTNSYLTFDVQKSFLLYSKYLYNRIYKISSTQAVLTADNLISGKMMQVVQFPTTANSTPSGVQLSLANFPTNKSLASIIATDAGNIFGVFIDNTQYKSQNNLYYYHQYLIPLTFAANKLTAESVNTSQSTTSGNTLQLSTDYVSNSTTLNTANFENNYYIYSANNGLRILLVAGAKFVATQTNGFQSFYRIDYNSASKSFSNVAYLDFTNKQLGSLTFSSNSNKVLISFNNTNDGIYLGFIDPSQTTLNITAIQQSTAQSTRDYFLIPVLEYKSKEYLLLQNNNKNIINYLLWNGSSYSQVNNASGAVVTTYFKYWTFQNVNNKSVYDGLGSSYYVTSVTPAVVAKYLNFNIFGSNRSTTQYSRTQNENYGILKLWIKIAYPASYLNAYQTYFLIEFDINGLYQKTSFIFNWIDANSTVDTQKANQVKTLKQTKYASQITAQDIINSFISYQIASNTGSSLVISTDNVALSYSNYYSTLTVTISLDPSQLPVGIPANMTKFTNTFTGFLSTQNYSVVLNDNNVIYSTTASIYPSQLTKQEIIKNFFTVGSSVQTDPKYWDIQISNVDDYNGTLNLSVSYTGYTNALNYSELPSDYANSFKDLIKDQSFVTFKALKTAMDTFNSDSISFQDYSSEYLPSEIYQQYLDYLNNIGSIDASNVILLNNLSSSVFGVNDLEIVCNNSNSCDADGFLDLTVSIKNNTTTKVEYNGNQFSSNNNYLVFDNQIAAKLDNYPFHYEWKINTTSKYFYVLDASGNKIKSSNNVYTLDLKTDSGIGINSQTYANQVTVNDIAKMFQIEGYNSSISLDSNQDDGWVKATINLALKNPPLVSQYDESANNQNLTRTLYIYNFAIPISKTLIYTLSAIGAAVGIVIIVLAIRYGIWQRKAIYYKNKATPLKEARKNETLLIHYNKKNRHFKKIAKIKKSKASKNK